VAQISVLPGIHGLEGPFSSDYAYAVKGVQLTIAGFGTRSHKPSKRTATVESTLSDRRRAPTSHDRSAVLMSYGAFAKAHTSTLRLHRRSHFAPGQLPPANFLLVDDDVFAALKSALQRSAESHFAQSLCGRMECSSADPLPKLSCASHGADPATPSRKLHLCPCKPATVNLPIDGSISAPTKPTSPIRFGSSSEYARPRPARPADGGDSEEALPQTNPR
jgi:hypothetical protein